MNRPTYIKRIHTLTKCYNYTNVAMRISECLQDIIFYIFSSGCRVHTSHRLDDEFRQMHLQANNYENVVHSQNSLQLLSNHCKSSKTVLSCLLPFHESEYPVQVGVTFAQYYQGLFVYVIAWFAVVFGINSTSKCRNNCTRRSRVQFTALRVLLIPNTTANHAITY